MKKAMLSLGLGIALVSCGSVNQPQDVSSTTSSPAIEQLSKKLKVGFTAENLAQEFANNDMTPEEAKKRIENFNFRRGMIGKELKKLRSGKANAERAYLEEKDEIVLKSYELLSSGKVKKTQNTTLQAQAYARATLLQATRNISTYSMSNFKYYQDRSTYSPPLSYFDDGCSSPGGVGGGLDWLFYPACDQHDFGYRNGKKFYETHQLNFKTDVDQRFLDNMSEICGNTYSDYDSLYDCYLAAEAYHDVVANVFVDQVWVNSPDNTDGLY